MEERGTGLLPKAGGKSRTEGVRSRQGGKSRRQRSERRVETEKAEVGDGGVAKEWMESRGSRR